MNAPKQSAATLASSGKRASYCYQCVAGPDLSTMQVQDGVAIEVEPNFAAYGVHPCGGKVCVKACNQGFALPHLPVRGTC